MTKLAGRGVLYSDGDGGSYGVHNKFGNVLNKTAKPLSMSAKTDIHDIWMPESPVAAATASERFAAKYKKKYVSAVVCLTKDQDALRAFCDLPAKHWGHLCSAGPIESIVATVRRRTVRSKGYRSHSTTLAIVFKLITTPAGG